MRNVSDERCKENQNTHFIYSNVCLNPAIDEIMLKNIEEPVRSQMTVWSERIGCWIF